MNYREDERTFCRALCIIRDTIQELHHLHVRPMGRRMLHLMTVQHQAQLVRLSQSCIRPKLPPVVDREVSTSETTEAPHWAMAQNLIDQIQQS